jgi:(1->4)-alpha-D-glucan 1-alpha-D-glucosylmutase
MCIRARRDAQVLVREQSKESSDWARRFAVATPETSTELKANLATAAQNTTMRRALEQAIAEMFEDSAALHELHEMQCWRLIHWRAARETLTYRRFFEIADLVGLKVESPRVFDEIHGRLGTLVAAGSVSGVRIDHIDGLADPKAYLERLQKTFPDDGQLYLLVEKIFGPDEELRSDWPVACRGVASRLDSRSRRHFGSAVRPHDRIHAEGCTRGKGAH